MDMGCGANEKKMTSMRVSLKKIRNKAMAFILGAVGTFTKANIAVISDMEAERCTGPTALSTKENG